MRSTVRVAVHKTFNHESPFPASLGPTEEALKFVRQALDYRTASFGNKRRTDRLLKLIAMHLNGHTDEAAWAEIIRQHLIERSGRAPRQRQHDEPLGSKSIRT